MVDQFGELVHALFPAHCLQHHVRMSEDCCDHSIFSFRDPSQPCIFGGSLAETHTFSVCKFSDLLVGQSSNIHFHGSCVSYQTHRQLEIAIFMRQLTTPSVTGLVA